MAFCRGLRGRSGTPHFDGHLLGCDDIEVGRSRSTEIAIALKLEGVELESVEIGKAPQIIGTYRRRWKIFLLRCGTAESDLN